MSLSEIMVQETTNIGQLVSQLSLSENVVQGRTMGTSRGVLYVFDERALIIVIRHSPNVVPDPVPHLVIVEINTWCYRKPK